MKKLFFVFFFLAGVLSAQTLENVKYNTTSGRVGTTNGGTTTNGKPLDLPANTTINGGPIGGGGGNAQTNANLDQFADVTQTIGAILNITGATTLPQTTVSGNAGSATKLATARAINGVPFDGTAAITVPAAGSTLTDPVLPINGALPVGGIVGQVLTKSGTANYAAGWQNAAGGTGSGDVSAAAPFGTDNRLVRSDGVAKGVQGSAVTLDDFGNLSGIATATSSDLSTSTFTILDDINHNFGLEIHEGTAFTSDHKLIFIGNTADVTFNFTASTNLTFPTSGTLLSSGGPGTFTGLSTSSYLQLTGIVTPTALAGPVNDYNPGFPAVIARIDPAGTGRSISGLLAQPNGTILEIQNISTTGTRVLTLADNNSGSVAANRFSFGGSDIVLNGGQSMVVWYDGASAAWRPFGRGVGSIATAGTYGDATHVPQFTLGVDGRIIGTPALVAVAGGGGGTPGGATTQVQFNNAGAFAGDAGFTYPGVTSTGANLFLQATGGQQWQIIAGGAAGLAGYYPNNSFVLYNGANTNTPLVITGGQLIVPVDYMIGWQPTRGALPDTGFSRNAAGIIEVNNGNVGQFADLKAKNLIASGAVTGNGSVPAGGGVSQVLTKNTATDYDVSWKTRLATKVVWLTTAGSSSFVTDTGVKALYIQAVGAGGGGGGAVATASNCSAGGGGGGGGFAAVYLATPQANYSYVVGGGGAGGLATGAAGATGGATTWGTFLSAAGGTGGAGDPGTTTYPRFIQSGTGGLATIGDAKFAGGDGFVGNPQSATQGISGFGGESTWGGLSRGQITPVAGNTGNAAGGGGAGGLSKTTTGLAGGAGADGAIRITEYF